MEVMSGVAVEATQGRECDCLPLHQDLCVHWDNKILRLSDKVQGNYRVSTMWSPPQGTLTCVCGCGGQIYWYAIGGGKYQDFTDYPSALAAFRKAEADLLGRSEE